MFTLECSTINSEISIAKVYHDKLVYLSWETNCIDEEGHYVIEFDGQEFIVEPKPNYTSWLTPELTQNKIYRWRLKEYDGFEYLPYSDYNYICYNPSSSLDLRGHINITTQNVKTTSEYLFSEIKVNTGGVSSLKGFIDIEPVRKILPAELNVNVPNWSYLKSEIEVKNRLTSSLNASVFIRTKLISPPKAPLLVNMEGGFDTIIGTLTPTFSWWKSNDELLKPNLSYEIQIDNNPSFIEPIFTKSNIRNPISDQMVYPLPIDLEKGYYYWRVRVFDNDQYSQWSYGNRFVIEEVTEELSSEIYITKKVGLESIYSELNIPFTQILPAEIGVIGESNRFLPSYIKVYAKKYEELYSELEVFLGHTDQTCNAEVEVLLQGESYLIAELHFNNIVCNLLSELNVLPKHLSDQKCKVVVFSETNEYQKCNIEIFKLKSFATFNSEIFIYKFPDKPYRSSIESRIVVWKSNKTGQDNSDKNEQQETKHNLEASIYVFPKQPEIYLNRELSAEISVLYKEQENLLSEIYVYSINPKELNVTLVDQNPDWNDYPYYTFCFEPKKGYELLPNGYVMCFDRYENSEPRLEGYALVNGEPKETTVYYNNLKTQFTVDMKRFEESGVYYFHVTYFYGNRFLYAPTAHYQIKWNKKPTVPSDLRVNGEVLVENNRRIPRRKDNVFSWSNSVDFNYKDKITYQIQFCNDLDFNEDRIKEFGYQKNNIEETELKINLSFLTGKKYYWRVRAFDQIQYSDWSNVEMFILNKIPPTPDDIIFYKKNQ